MKKKLLTLLMILGLVIAQIPGAGVLTASAAGARNYLAALNGGNVHWEEATDGDAKIGDVYAGSQIEFAGYYELPEGSSVNLTAIPLGSNTFVGWYTRWNSTEPVLVSDSLTYTWTLPTESGMTLTAVFQEAHQPPLLSALTLGVTNGGSVSGSATDALGAPTPVNGTGTYYYQGASEFTLTAAPENDYTFKGWYSGTVDSSGTVVGNDGTLVSSANPYSFTVAEGTGISLQAVFEPALTVLTPIPAVTVNVTPPLTGSSASNALSGVSVPAGEHYSLFPYVAVYDTEPVFDNFGNPVTEPFTGNFEEDKTYYMGISVKADPGYTFQQGGGSYANTTVAVNGATLLYGSDLWISNMITDSGYESYGNILISFTPVPSNMWIDNCIDNSKSYITGVVHLTGAGGTQAGYNNEDGTGKTVYSAEATVTYTNPKTSTVQGYINDAYTQTYNLANACKNAGKSGEFHMSTSETTGMVWDNRRYRTFEYNPETSQWEYTNGLGETEVFTGTVPAEAGPATRIHTADGDYGKETFYKVEANGWVGGYAITVTNDGNGTASADLAASLANETVTLTATPSDGYAFKEWQVVSGGATLTDSTAASTTFTMPASDVEVKAVFEIIHTHILVKTERVAPGCETTGTEAYWTCSECGKMFSDSNATTEITAPVVISATGHSWDAGTITKTPTCSEKGVRTYLCKNDSNHYKQEEVEALGHSWDEGVVTKEPTCTEKGEKSFTCKNDASHTKTEEVEALGHDWSEWKIVKEPTETEDGEETRSCSRCNEVEVRVIPHLVVEYRITEGDGSSWEIGGTGSLTFVAKRSVNDDTTFSHFTGISVDGTTVDAANYEAVAGSVKITVKPEYLGTLATGKHAITVMFDDADAATGSFTVTEKPAPTATPAPTNAPDNKVPNTGDTNNLWIWALMFIIALTAMLIATNKQSSRR